MAIEDERPVVLAAWIGTATLEGLCPALVARFQHLGDHGIQNGFHISHISKGLSIPRRDCLLARVENMLDRLRVEPPAILLFMDNLTQSFYRTARENWLHARTAHTGSLEYSYVGLHKIETFHLVSTCLHCLVSVQHFRNLVLLMLGELPVQRICAFYKYRSSLTNFCTSDFCKRSRLFCVLNSDTMVLDSEWHWIFDCNQFSSLRSKYPHFSTILRSIREKSIQQNFSIDTDGFVSFDTR